LVVLLPGQPQQIEALRLRLQQVGNLEVLSGSVLTLEEPVVVVAVAEETLEWK
jgi:hypothetical protein